MKTLRTASCVPASLAVVMLVFAPLLASSDVEARRRAAAGCGPRGCAAVGRSVGPVHRPAVRPPVRRGVVVVAPRRYWRPGAAIAAGAAIGVVTGAAAVALAGSPPQAGQCWYYTSPARTTGFWDACPR